MTAVKRRVGIATFAFGVTMAGMCRSDDGPMVYGLSAPSVMIIRAFGVRADQTMDGETGSGFVISEDGFVLTASHVIPDEKNHKSIIIGGSLGPSSTEAKPYQLALVKRSETFDVALLRVVGPPVHLAPLPLRNATAKVGEQLFVLGYPLGLPDTHLLDGRVGDVKPDALTTNALVDRGNSGGPVLDASGCVIGLVYGGVASNEGQPVNGIKFAVPVASLRDWLPKTATPPAEAVKTPANDVIHVSDTLSRIQTDHALTDTVRSYHDTIDARAGFVIQAVETVGHLSLNPPDLQYPVPAIMDGGKGMTFDYSLVSGPIYDKRRGWIDMTIQMRLSLDSTHRRNLRGRRVRSDSPVRRKVFRLRPPVL